MVQVNISRISEGEQKDPEFLLELAAFQKCFDALEKNPREKFRLCLHEAGHIVFNRRLGWEIAKFHGPYAYRNDEGKLCLALGAVTPVRGEADDFLAIVKTDIGGFVLVEGITGEPNSEAAINGDVRILNKIKNEDEDNHIDEAVAEATQEIIGELNDEAFMRELIGAVREYENAVFGTDETWLWGWKEFRLDLPGQRYAMGPCANPWLLIEHEDKLRFIVPLGKPEGGLELPPNDENLQYMNLSPRDGSGERAAELVRRWNEQVRVKGEEKVR